MKHAQKFTVSALALAISSAAIISTTATAAPFANGNPVQTVTIVDDVWYNPAYLSEKETEISITSGGQGGFVFDAFGQKLGVHAGRNVISGNWQSVANAEVTNNNAQTLYNFSNPQGFQATGGLSDPTASPGAFDLFWAAGDLGVQGTVQSSRNSSLALTSVTSPGGATVPLTDGSHTVDDGAPGSTHRAEVSENSNVNSANHFGTRVGTSLMNGGLEVIGGFALVTYGASESISYETQTNQGAGGGGTTTQREINNVDSEVAFSSNFSFETGAMGRFWLSDAFYGIGSFQLNRYSQEGSIDISERQRIDNNNDGSFNTDRTEITKYQSERDTTNTAIAIGAGLIDERDDLTFRVEQRLRVQLASTSSSSQVDEDRTVDNNTGDTLGTEGTTGTTFDNSTSSLTLTMPMRASVEARPDDSNWTWRAGMTADLLQWMTADAENSQYEVDGSSYEQDFTQITQDSSMLRMINSGPVLTLGAGYELVDDLVIDAVVNQGILTGDGPFQEGFASNFSVTYAF